MHIIIDDLRLTMKYQDIITFLDNTPNQPFKFRIKNWVEIKHGYYNSKSQIKLKTAMLKSGLCDCSNGYILVKGTITITRNAGPRVRRTEA